MQRSDVPNTCRALHSSLRTFVGDTQETMMTLRVCLTLIHIAFARSLLYYTTRTSWRKKIHVHEYFYCLTHVDSTTKRRRHRYHRGYTISQKAHKESVCIMNHCIQYVCSLRGGKTRRVLDEKFEQKCAFSTTEHKVSKLKWEVSPQEAALRQADVFPHPSKYRTEILALRERLNKNWKHAKDSWKWNYGPQEYYYCK